MGCLPRSALGVKVDLAYDRPTNLVVHGEKFEIARQDAQIELAVHMWKYLGNGEWSSPRCHIGLPIWHLVKLVGQEESDIQRLSSGCILEQDSLCRPENNAVNVFEEKILLWLGATSLSQQNSRIDILLLGKDNGVSSLEVKENESSEDAGVNYVNEGPPLLYLIMSVYNKRAIIGTFGTCPGAALHKGQSMRQERSCPGIADIKVFSDYDSKLYGNCLQKWNTQDGGGKSDEGDARSGAVQAT
ncbi:hypothetical protein Tco_0415701 [Tanacetum coccineum]